MKKNKTPGKEVLELHGNSYVIVPRKVLHMLHKANDYDLLLTYRVVCALITYCYYKDSYVKLHNTRYKCRRGEYIGSYRSLAELTGISRRVIEKNKGIGSRWLY